MVFILTFEKDSHFWNRWNIYLFGCSRCQPRFIDQKAGFESCLYLVIHSILRNSSPKLPNIHWCINISQRYNFNISVIEILSILQRHNIDILLKYYQAIREIPFWGTGMFRLRQVGGWCLRGVRGRDLLLKSSLVKIWQSFIWYY